MRQRRLAVSFAAALMLAAGSAWSFALANSATPAAVLKTYGDVAQAMYTDAHSQAEQLKTAVASFLDKPTPETLDAARIAWKASRPLYQQTEAYRFGNAIVDDWEGKVNSWPLDEGLIDYTDAGSYGEASDENPLYTANVIASKSIRVGADTIDASTIDKTLLGKLQEAGGVEANVATGYHAIEFLLWGQDLNGTGPGAGKRPATDYDLKACTHDNCDRRRAYLSAAVDLLIDDLAEMKDDWADGGKARTELAAKGEDGGLATILTGIGSLSYGELAGERMKLGLILHDPEEEHDCFSDNTHNSHYADQAGMVSIWKGTYTKLDGSEIKRPGIADLAAAKAPDAAKRVEEALANTSAKMQVLKDTADSGKMAYDQMIGANNPEGNKIVQDAIDGLVGQTRAIEGLVTALNLKITVEGSDSLDNPTAVKSN